MLSSAPAVSWAGKVPVPKASSPAHRALRGIALLLALAASGCNGRDDSPGRVAASIFPLYDVTRRVAGNRVPVDLVLPPGQSEHSFDPKPGDVARLAHARMVFASERPTARVRMELRRCESARACLGLLARL